MFSALEWQIPVGEWCRLPHDQRSTMVATVVAKNLIDAAVLKAAEAKRGKP